MVRVRKTQFFTLTTFFLIAVLTLLISVAHSDSLYLNDLVQDNMVSSEISYQLNNIFSVLSEVLNVDFKRSFQDEVINVTMHSNIDAGMSPATKLSNFNSFLSTYGSKIGLNLDYSFSDLITDVNNNDRYIRTFSPHNVQVLTDYSNDKIIYSNSDEINSYKINLSFSGSISGVNWSTTPAGSDIPVIIIGPNGFSDSYTLDTGTNYDLTINMGSDSVFFEFNAVSDETTIDYSNVDDLDNVILDFTTSLPLDENVFKITSPYPNTEVNLSFGDYFISRGFE